MIWLCLIFAFDDPTVEKQRSVELRNTSMKFFLKEISQSGIEDISRSYSNHNLFDRCNCCHGWIGIFCENEQITRIVYERFLHGNFNVHALPHSTKYVTITECFQTFEINTRLFPRGLREIYMQQNKIYGSLDLTVLPKDLTLCFLWSNMLTGPISLINLPRGLQKLYLSGNKFTQKTVWYDDLPPYLSEIFLLTMDGIYNIKEVRSVHQNSAVKEKAIFRQMETKHVH